MSITNLKINNNCNQCGSCLGCGYKFLSTAGDGSVTVESGTVLEKDSVEFNTLKDICPMDAFEIEVSIDKNKILSQLIEELKSHAGIPLPTEKDFDFNEKEYHISIPYASGEYRYDYSSDSAAERSAQREFERAMYSQVDNLILKIVTEYRVKKVKPYYVDSIEKGSVYAKNNEYISELLMGINNTMDGKLGSDFSKVTIMPDRETAWEMLNKGELLSEDLLSIVKQNFDYSASDYSFKWNTDDMEIYEGTGLFGGDKYTYKYCYKDIRNAFEELAKDILFCCHLSDTDIEKRAIEVASWVVNVYNKQLKELIDEKIQQIEKMK